MNIIVLANNSCERDARIIRSAEAAAAAGHTVTILAHTATGLPSDDRIEQVRYLRFGWRTGFLAGPKTNPAFAALLGLTTYFLTLNVHRYVSVGASLNPDIIHAHDLYTLMAGWLIAKKTGARLIYDSHELEIGRNISRRLIEDRSTRVLAERFLIKRVDAVITVSESIADFLARRYTIPKPIVVYNTPRIVSSPISTDIRSFLGMDASTKLAIYIGAVAHNRGLEAIAKALRLMPSVHVAIIGPGVRSAIGAELKRIASSLSVDDRLHFVDPVPSDEVTSFVKTADASLILVQDSCLSYKYSFPNKMLESLFAGVPVVVSKLPEYERLIEKTGAGLSVDQKDPVAIATGVQKVLANRAVYSPTPEMLADLAREFGWSAQAEKLLALYDRMKRSGPRALAASTETDGYYCESGQYLDLQSPRDMDCHDAPISSADVAKLK